MCSCVHLDTSPPAFTDNSVPSQNTQRAEDKKMSNTLRNHRTCCSPMGRARLPPVNNNAIKVLILFVSSQTDSNQAGPAHNHPPPSRHDGSIKSQQLDLQHQSLSSFFSKAPSEHLQQPDTELLKPANKQKQNKTKVTKSIWVLQISWSEWHSHILTHCSKK